MWASGPLLKLILKYCIPPELCTVVMRVKFNTDSRNHWLTVARKAYAYHRHYHLRNNKYKLLLTHTEIIHGSRIKRNVIWFHYKRNGCLAAASLLSLTAKFLFNILSRLFSTLMKRERRILNLQLGVLNNSIISLPGIKTKFTLISCKLFQ